MDAAVTPFTRLPAPAARMQSDLHGTNTLWLDSTAQLPAWRQFDPYGVARGAAATAGFPGSRGFLGDVADTGTGLTNVGARWYDPATGMFASLDPVLEAASPLQLNGYDYAGSDPVTGSDPTGLTECDAGYCPTPQQTQQVTQRNQQPAGCPASEPGCPGYAPPPITLNPSQVDYMRNSLGYTGSAQPTRKQLSDWLGGTYQKNAAWDFYCQGILGQGVGGCNSNPYNGDHNVYGDPLSITDYGFIGLQGCVVVCAGITYQDATIQVAVGGLGFGGWGKAIGVNAYKPTTTASWSFGACAAIPYGACVQGTKDDHNNIRYGAGVAIGEGGFAGLMYDPVTLNFGNQVSSILWWHWRM